MRAVITVIGKDTVGILAKVSTACAQHNINVLEVTQSILQDMFAQDTEGLVKRFFFTDSFGIAFADEEFPYGRLS